jgi:hypothetical protein
MRVLRRAEAWAVEHFFETENCTAAPASFDERDVRVDGRLSNFGDWRRRIAERRRRLNESADDCRGMNTLRT